MAMAVQQILAEKQAALTLQSLYSSDLTPCDFVSPWTKKWGFKVNVLQHSDT
jgi:hypothetical protein